MKIQKSSLEKIEILIAFLIIIAVYFSGLNRVDFDRDETHWIAYSDRFEMFFQGDFKNSHWYTEWNRYINPVMTYYIIGIGRNIGGFGPKDLNIPFDFTQNMTQNKTLGAIPSPELLWWSRASVTFVTVIALIIVFWLMLKAFGRISAYLWLGFVCLNQYIRIDFRQAINEGPMLFFIMLTILAVYFLLKTGEDADLSKSWKKMAAWLVVAGFGVGFAAEAKTTGGAAIIGVILALIGALIRSRASWLTKMVYALLGIGLLGVASFLAFILPNPTAWENPLLFPQRVIDARLELIKNQSDDDQKSVIYSWSKRPEIVTQRIFNEYMQFPTVFPTFLFFLAGLISIIQKIYHWLRHQNKASSLVALSSVGLSVGIPSLLTPLDWGRYYSLAVFFFAIPVIVGFQRFIFIVLGKKMN